MTDVQHSADPAGGADRLALMATLRAAGAARHHVRSVLSGNGCSADDLDTAVLLTSELVTNAVRHGVAPIAVRLSHWNASLRVEVRDAGGAFAPPAASAWDLSAQGGRGLALVEALATSWGSTVHDDMPIGKSVWFEIIRPFSPADSG